MPQTRKQHCDSSDCPLAHALDIMGDKWTLIIIRDMITCNKHEYKEFMQSPEGISTNILADRLKKLEQAEIIKSMPHPDYKTRKLYYLTRIGKEFSHVLTSLVGWAEKHQGDRPLSKDGDNQHNQYMKARLEDLRVWEALYLK